MTSITHIPSDDTISEAITLLHEQHSTLGIVKLHSLLLSENPTWTVSEKRARRIYKPRLSLPESTTSIKRQKNGTSTTKMIYPSSRVVTTLDIGKYSKKVEVRYFDKIKGKGLVATQPIAKDEVVWKEDPYIIAPEWEIYDLITSGTACAYCTTTFDSLLNRGLELPCSAGCQLRFCNRLCLNRSAGTHPLVCRAQNPASAALLKMARQLGWMALNALAMCTSRILLANQHRIKTEAAKRVEEEWTIVCGFAELGMEERYKYSGMGQGEPDREMWDKAYKLFLNAFKNPTDASENKKLAKLLKNPLPAHIESGIFEYEAFLRGLGRMSLNLEAHGGLYALHSHLNHSCAPTISVRHIDQRTALSRISLIAKEDIAVGEELLVTYVDPTGGLDTRRHALKEWGFGTCVCTRCAAEEKGRPKSEQQPAAFDMGDLERELKAGLGVM